MFKAKPKDLPPNSDKTFSEDPDPSDFAAIIMSELLQTKSLNKAGDGDSSSGSGSAPSEDNLDAAKLAKNLPEVDKNVKKKIKQEEERKAEELKAAEAAKKAAI